MRVCRFSRSLLCRQERQSNMEQKQRHRGQDGWTDNQTDTARRTDRQTGRNRQTDRNRQTGGVCVSVLPPGCSPSVCCSTLLYFHLLPLSEWGALLLLHAGRGGCCCHGNLLHHLNIYSHKNKSINKSKSICASVMKKLDPGSVSM